jgi:DNA-binding NarL/FixJ family response regulator
MTAGGPVADGVPTRCLIADDQAMVREGFAAVLAAQPGLLVVGQAADRAGDALLAPSVTRRLIADFARRPRPDPPFPAALSVLTPRESEVLRLLAHGLSKTEISDTLVIAEQTTKTHVGRILAKLDLRDRAQAVVLAYQTGLVTPGGSAPARTNPDTGPRP